MMLYVNVKFLYAVDFNGYSGARDSSRKNVKRFRAFQSVSCHFFCGVFVPKTRMS